MAISDKSFAEHSSWLAFQRNRFQWPKHWQVVIFKIYKQGDPVWGNDKYSVLPANPEYQEYLNRTEATYGSVHYMEEPPPPMHLDPIVFDSMEDINQWALVAHRLR